MKSSLTHPVLQVVLLKAMKAWLQRESQSAADITLEHEEYEDKIIQAPSNQDAIGWNNFFIGRLSKQWSDIQQHHYDTINRHRNDRCQDFLAPNYSGQWWASNLIKEIVFYSLNEWQIRNNKLHADLTNTNTIQTETI
jgi:hypothetical protein